MNKFMQKALQEAEYGILHSHGGPFGAVIVKDGTILAQAHNMVLANNDPTAHGEIGALRAGGEAQKSFDFSGCDLYTTGEPCPMCLAACMWANIDTVYYGCTIADNEKIGFRDKLFDNIMQIDRQKLPVKLVEIDRADCLQLFDQYNGLADKKNY
jgi:tRNA(Arg) A34 adenosine deaminase TadA